MGSVPEPTKSPDVSPAKGPANDLALTMEQHAGIAVALAEGFSRADVLAQEQVTEAAYRPADVAWKKRLVDSAAGDAKLFADYQQKKTEAEDWLRRDIAPLESDLPSWMGFLKAWGTSKQPFEMLSALGLTLGDMGRLGRHWARAFEKDPKLGQRAEKLSKDANAAKMPASVTVGKAVLRPFPWSPGAPPAPPPVPPEIKVEEDSPPPPAPPEIGPIVPVTPSFMREDAAPAGRGGVDEISNRPLQKPGSGGAILPSYARDAGMGGTTPVFYIKPGDAVPFAPKEGVDAGPLPAASPVAKPAQSGETALAVELPAVIRQALSRAGATPFDRPEKKPDPDPRGAMSTGTIGVFDLKELVLPFAPSQREAPSAPAPLALKPPVAPEIPKAASPPRLSILEHAAPTAELALGPERAAEIHARWGVDVATRMGLDAYFDEVRKERPAAASAWAKAYRDAYTHHILARMKGPGR